MKLLKDKTEYTVQFHTQELKDIWWFFNDYLCMNPEPKGDYDTKHKTAKKFCEDFKFVT